MTELTKTEVISMVCAFSSACVEIHNDGLSSENLGMVKSQNLALRIKLTEQARAADNIEDRDLLNNLIETAGQMTVFYARAFQNIESIGAMFEILDTKCDQDQEQA